MLLHLNALMIPALTRTYSHSRPCISCHLLIDILFYYTSSISFSSSSAECCLQFHARTAHTLHSTPRPPSHLITPSSPHPRVHPTLHSPHPYLSSPTRLVELYIDIDIDNSTYPLLSSYLSYSSLFVSFDTLCHTTR
ncbi:hypothetical protein B0H19DRAFT_481784 [Mycena capillaripes]|nr:hypothetical protein B0H19DRAFT_481784 [Mycena capillaripes]